MPVNEGGFVWYELMTSDPPAAQDFYNKVIGWGAACSGVPGISYTLLNVGERPVAGVKGIPPEARDRPAAWMGYILAADVDAMAERVKQLGGSVHRLPAETRGVGRFAVVADPQGAVFMLFRGDGTQPPDLGPFIPGVFGWHELHACDWEASFAFYNGLFGWEKSQAVDMGAIGTYQTFGTAGVWGGGMFNSPHPAAPFWLYYINVENIDAAAALIGEAGGLVLQGPLQVPGGSWIVQATDPQGAMFALVGPRPEAETEA